MKKKTVYNIIMLAAIAAIAAVAVLLVGRHLGWFDKAAPEGEATAISATVRKGLANLERGGIASELKGQTQLRQGDVISVASGYVAVEADTGSLMLSQGSRLDMESMPILSAISTIPPWHGGASAGFGTRRPGRSSLLRFWGPFQWERGSTWREVFLSLSFWWPWWCLWGLLRL